MILFVQKDCPFCKDAIDRVEHVFYVVQHPDGRSFYQVGEDRFLPLPSVVKGLPALLVGQEWWEGESLIKQVLDKIKPQQHPVLSN
jgi:hypothetical protein